MPLYLLIPLGCAVVYTLSSLFFKRGYLEGAGTVESFHWANVLGIPLFLPLFWVRPGDLPLVELWRPLVTSLLIFAGSWATFAAIQKGDVSVVTPVLGTKVVFVALGAVFLAGTQLSGALWMAAFLATAGIFLVGMGDVRPGRARWAAVWLCLFSAFCYGLTDVLIGMWAERYGGTVFLGLLPQFIGLFSLLLIPVTAPGTFRIPSSSRRWVIWGCVLLSLQGMGMGLALAFCHDPTGVNIVYSTRGLWSIVLVWFLGGWFGNRERGDAGTRAMSWRMAGTAMITAGVVLAVLARSGRAG